MRGESMMLVRTYVRPRDYEADANALYAQGWTVAHVTSRPQTLGWLGILAALWQPAILTHQRPSELVVTYVR